MTRPREKWICPECGAVNDGVVCRIDAALRVDLASAAQAGWQCPWCSRLNREGDAECRGCDGPKPSFLDRQRDNVLWIILAVVALGTVVGLVFLPFFLSIGAVVAVVGGVFALARTAFARQAVRFETRADAIVFVGCCLWVVAQALPAYTQAPHLGDEPRLAWGIIETLFDWMLFFWVPDLSGALLAFAWSSNVWLALAVLARWRWPELMLPFAVLAAVACAVGLGILIAGGVPEPGGRISEIGAGSWLWFAGTLIVLAGAAVSFAERFTSRSSLRT